MRKERKLLFFINPISGTKNKTGLEELLIKKTTAAGFTADIEYTNASGNYRYLKQKILAENITDVIICGGDGSVNQVGQHLIYTNINLGIIPMGSGNGLALTAGISKTVIKALAIIFKGNVEVIDGFKINDRFSCMLCGLGLDAQVAADFAARGKRGLMNYIRQSTIDFFTAKPYDFEVITDSFRIETPAFFISIANSNQFGNQFTIAPKASLSDGLLDIVIVKKMNKLKMIWEVLKQVKSGTPGDLNDSTNDKAQVLYFQASKLKIKNPGMAPLHIDGEAVDTSHEFNIEIISGALRLLQPVVTSSLPA